MHIFITGASGGLGRTSVEWCLEQGMFVSVLMRPSSHAQQLAADWVQQYPNRIAVHWMDLSHLNNVEYGMLCKMLSGCDAVWHIGAKADDWGIYDEFIQTNVVATRRLAQAAISIGVQAFIFVSTPAVYFDYRSKYNVREDDVAKKTVNAYAESKLMAEHVISGLSCNPTTRMVTLRPRALIGKYDRILIPRLLNRIRMNRLMLPRGGQTVLDLTSMDNVVSALWSATTSNAEGVFNITNDKPVVLKDALLMFQEAYTASGKTCPFQHIIDIPVRVGDTIACISEYLAQRRRMTPSLTRYSVGVISYDMTLNVDRARKYLNYTPTTTLKQSVYDYVSYQGANHG